MGLNKLIPVFGLAFASILLLGVFVSSDDFLSTENNLIEPAFAQISQTCAKPGPSDPPATLGIVMHVKDQIQGDLDVKKYTFKHTRSGTNVQGSSQSSAGYPTWGNFVVTKNLDHGTCR